MMIHGEVSCLVKIKIQTKVEKISELDDEKKLLLEAAGKDISEQLRKTDYEILEEEVLEMEVTND